MSKPPSFADAQAAVDNVRATIVAAAAGGAGQADLDKAVEAEQAAVSDWLDAEHTAAREEAQAEAEAGE